jgi:DcuC family C4-dicarboxylate transporter
MSRAPRRRHNFTSRSARMEWFPGVVALLAAAGAVVLVVKGWDVRLVLLSAALVTACAAGTVPVVLREFLATFSNEKFVVPICTAMGFAYVLKHTGCERHLVLLLIRPLRRVKFLLVPGVVLVGFVVNIPLISQTSTAVCLGAVVVPLMRAAGYSLPTIGACLLLGASVGGELLNPGAPELLSVFSKTGVSTTEQARSYLPPLVFTQLAVSTLVIWAMSAWWERNAKAVEAVAKTEDEEWQAPTAKGAEPVNEAAEDEKAATWHELPSDAPERINVLKALVPLVPLVLLFAAAPPFSVIDIPDAWVIARKADDTRDPAYSSRLIGLAMLVGVLVAAAVTPSKARDCVKEFFNGAGYGFANIVSLIVTATCFGKAIESAGVARALGELITRAPELMQPLAALVPLAFAALCGSGMASTQSLYGFFHGPAEALGLNAVDVGALVSLGSAAGRTMSPVAAVVLMCASLTGANPFALAKRVAVPLLAGIAVVIVLRVLHVL